MAQGPSAEHVDASPASPGPDGPGYADFTEFYHADFARLAAQMYVYLGDRGDAEDVVQEAYLRAWQRWDAVSRYTDPIGWVRRVAWNLATSRLRRLTTAARLRGRFRPADAVAAPGPEHVALVAALRKLPRQQRVVVVMHYIGDLSVDDIATSLDVPKGTVMSWLSRGRTRLAAILGDADAVRSGGGRHG
jgi:RNA polymerase sigma-70 factor (ECF subfamily)